jgi:phosphoribosylcarboxyaminoimidazole (NCAIR) mutase
LHGTREADILFAAANFFFKMSQPDQPGVGILTGRDSGWPVRKAAADALEEFRVGSEARVIPAHPDPQGLAADISPALERGLKVILAFAVQILAAGDARRPAALKQFKVRLTAESRAKNQALPTG